MSPIAAQTPNAVTIDVSGPSPEQDDECLNRHAEDLLKLIALWLLQDASSANEGLRSFLSSSEVQRNVDAVVLRCEELHEQRKEYLHALSASGWFLGPDTPVTQLQVLRDSLGTNGGIERSTIELYFQERMDSIESELSEAYPRRRHILHDAFEAHKAGKYTLSVPVFLSQADGIWRDQFGRHFFGRDARKSTLQDCLKNVQLQYVVTMLNLLEPRKKNNNQLWASETERDSSFTALNRHQVLHGEDVDYAKEENSLKAISLLDCFRALHRRVAR